MFEVYENPLCRRYASREMQEIFSEDRKFTTWRKLWVALAESQQELGLPITDEQLREMKAHIADINYEAAQRREEEVRHDVMAHIYAYGVQCPQAKPIIHLGATSCYVGDNTDVILQKAALQHIKKLLLTAIQKASEFAEQYQDLPVLAYTHFQAAQPTTMGKRAALWIQDMCMDLEHLDFVLERMKLLGCKGTTGTGASFLALFEGDQEKVKQLEQKIAAKIGFDSVYAVSGQTYTRKADYYILSVLSGIAQSAYKFSNDIRLLSHLKEVEEPFESRQVGSSAMAYKRNPMRSERIASLARYVIVNALNGALTASGQWFERTLDDSANKRISIPEGFLAVDAILSLYINVISGLSIYPKVIEKHLAEELPFLATETILMHGTKKGGDRQQLHEAIREHSIEASRQMKLFGASNDLLERIAQDEQFGMNAEEIQQIMHTENFTGMAKEQTEEFLAEVKAVMERNKEFMEKSLTVQIRV